MPSLDAQSLSNPILANLACLHSRHYYPMQTRIISICFQTLSLFWSMFCWTSDGLEIFWLLELCREIGMSNKTLLIWNPSDSVSARADQIGACSSCLRPILSTVSEGATHASRYTQSTVSRIVKLGLAFVWLLFSELGPSGSAIAAGKPVQNLFEKAAKTFYQAVSCDANRPLGGLRSERKRRDTAG